MPFTFSTSNEYHPSGLGAWHFALNENGQITAAWHRFGKATPFGPFFLSGEENARVWGLIEEVNFPMLSSSSRMGFPDEVTYTFTLQTPAQTHTVSLWAGDVKHLQTLVVAIHNLIEHQTGYNPHLA